MAKVGANKKIVVVVSEGEELEIREIDGAPFNLFYGNADAIICAKRNYIRLYVGCDTRL